MENKEIYIDGVDVSGCEHRCDTHKTLLADGHIMEFKNYCQITNDGCYAIDCYYKQLKRKEQECERLKGKLIKWLGKEGITQSEKEFYEEQLDQLKANLLDQEAETLKAGGIIHKLSNCLTEIKEIAKGIAKSTYDSYPYGGDVETWEAKRAKQILQKISECEGNNEKY